MPDVPAAPVLFRALRVLVVDNDRRQLRATLDMLAALGRKAAAAHGRATVRSTGADAATQRFDGWELAAARTAAVARALRSGGLDEKRIAIDLPAMDGGAPGSGPGGGQRIGVLLRGAR